MYLTLLALHSLVRWLVSAALLLALFRAYRGWLSKKVFSRFDDSLRHWTATLAHIQLLLGICLYVTSPLTGYLLQHYKDGVQQREIRFFGMEHSLMMLTAVVVLTVGSALAKRKPTDSEKFKTMALWFTAVLLIILIAVPWPFSPFVGRPYFRPF